MSAFTEKVAIITGGASGIGRALGEELAGRGARVVLADRNGPQATAVADAIALAGGRAEAAPVDVCDAVAVQRLITQTAAAHGRLDYLFNNAGIALAGETRDMTLDQWNQMIDVNVRGVVHGVMAAYPVMIAQGFGHIVNTASLAGLTPAPSFTAYAATKHAVVGLSLSLRAEAARRGVRVSVVCPGVIDTPIKDSMTFLNVDRETALKSMPMKLHSPADCARTIARGVERNRPIITVTAMARVAWLLYRLSPALMSKLVGIAARHTLFLAPER